MPQRGRSISAALLSHWKAITVVLLTACVWIAADNKMLPVLFQRWLLEKTACILATAHLHTAKKRLMCGLSSEKGLSPENYSSILMGPILTSGWQSQRSYRSIMGYSCFSVEWVDTWFFISKLLTSLTAVGMVLWCKLSALCLIPLRAEKKKQFVPLWINICLKDVSNKKQFSAVKKTDGC